MKQLARFAFPIALAMASQTSFASPELARQKNCMACHAPSTKLVGPSFKDIAAKYGSDTAAEGKLVTKIQKGSTGTWGPVPMPANPQVNEADARTLVKWIMTQK